MNEPKPIYKLFFEKQDDDNSYFCCETDEDLVICNEGLEKYTHVTRDVREVDIEFYECEISDSYKIKKAGICPTIILQKAGSSNEYKTDLSLSTYSWLRNKCKFKNLFNNNGVYVRIIT